MNYHPNEYVFENFTFSALTNGLILKHSSGQVESGSRLDIHPQSIEINRGSFTHASTTLRFPTVVVQHKEQALVLACGCQAPKDKLCDHQTQVLYALMNREEIRVFFDDKLRHEKLKSLAIDYGLENEANLDDYFQLAYVNRSLEIKPKLPELFALNEASMSYLETNLIPAQGFQLPQTIGQDGNSKMIVVIGQHKFYNHLYIELLEAQATQGGKIKNPLKPIPPLDLIWGTEKNEELKFYTAISKFQNNYSA
ncbi:MAG: ATP-dependent helicase, partial [Bacteroidota bacterium]